MRVDPTLMDLRARRAALAETYPDPTLQSFLDADPSLGMDPFSGLTEIEQIRAREFLAERLSQGFSGDEALAAEATAVMHQRAMERMRSGAIPPALLQQLQQLLAQLQAATSNNPHSAELMNMLNGQVNAAAQGTLPPGLSPEDLVALLTMLNRRNQPQGGGGGGGGGRGRPSFFRGGGGGGGGASPLSRGSAGPSTSGARGTSPTDLSHVRTSGNGQRLLRAIAGQESGGSYTPINRDAAHADSYGIGAIGRYQMLGSNVAAWSRAAANKGLVPQDVAARLARDPAAIARDPSLHKYQDIIAASKMEDYAAEAERRGYHGGDAVRYVASAWYSGSGNNLNSSRPQGGYPSIRAYTFSVLDRYNSVA